MSGYLIGEVCQALDVKPHILRYWEQQIPLLKPRKDQAGRRLYSARELQILYRLRYLIRVRKLTTEGAAQKLVEELSGAERRTGIQLLRENLLQLGTTARALGRIACEETEIPDEIDESQTIVRAAWPRLSRQERDRILAQLAYWNAPVRRNVYAALPADARAWRSFRRGAPARDNPRDFKDDATRPAAVAVSLQPWRKPVPQQWLPVAGAQPKAVLVTIGGAPVSCIRSARTTLPDVQRAQEVMQGATRSGMQVVSWIVALDPGMRPLAGVSGDLPSPVPQYIVTRPLPFFDRNGRYSVSPRGLGVLSYHCRLLVAARTVVYGPLRTLIDDADVVIVDNMSAGTTGCVAPPELPLCFEPGITDAVTIAIVSDRKRHTLCGTIAVSPQLLVEVVECGAGTIEIMSGNGTDDTQVNELCAFRLRIVDLLRHARRPRVYVFQETK